MKKLIVPVMALSMVAPSIPAMMHATPQMNMVDDKNPPRMTLQGTVKADGEEITFVNDKDGKSWEVINPETLKPHVGHHVELNAHVYAEKAQIHVMSVKMMKIGDK